MFGGSLARLLPVAAVGLGLGLGACAGRNPPPPPEAGRQLAARDETIWIRPGGAGSARFVLTTLAGLAVPGEGVSFSIVDDPARPGSAAQGATLAAGRATTDDSGVAEAQVTGGLDTRFLLRAQSGAAEAEMLVVVAPDVLGSV